MTAMTLVSTVTVGAAGAAQIEWTGIPQIGKDLMVLVCARGADSELRLTFNSDSATRYNMRRLQGNGSTVSSSQFTGSNFEEVRINQTSTTANTFSNSMIYIPNYTSTAAKSFSIDALNENNATAALMQLRASGYTGTGAITTLRLGTSAGNLVEHSTASLYIIS